MVQSHSKWFEKAVTVRRCSKPSTLHQTFRFFFGMSLDDFFATMKEAPTSDLTWLWGLVYVKEKRNLYCQIFIILMKSRRTKRMKTQKEEIELKYIKKGSIINSEFVLSSALLFFLTLVGVCLFKHELISVIKQGWTTLSIREPHVIKIIRPIIYSIRMQAFTTRVLIEHIHKENLPYQPYIT